MRSGGHPRNAKMSKLTGHLASSNYRKRGNASYIVVVVVVIVVVVVVVVVVVIYFKRIVQ